MREGTERADIGWDGYAERVLRNEARLAGLEALVAETRAADQKLIEQRSNSLANELERRAEAVTTIGREERESDRREVITLSTEQDRRNELAITSLREVYNTAMQKNYEQSRGAISALEQRRQAATDRIEQMVRQWRESDGEARALFASELGRHLDALNHNNERMREFQANSVTRELWTSEKDAAIAREGLLRDQIISLDKTMLLMTPIALSDKSHAEMIARMETTVASAIQVIDNKIDVNSEKIAELKSYRDTTSGRSSGYSSLYALIGAALAMIVSVIVIANYVTSR